MNIANRQATEEEILAAEMAGIFFQFGRIMTEAGGYPIFRQGIDDPMYRQALLDFHQNYVSSVLSYAALLKWLQENGLEEYLAGGSLEKQVDSWEIFYQEFYGKEFKLDRKKIFIETRRLPSIVAGLKNGVVNSVEIESTPEILTGAEQLLTDAEYFCQMVLKKTGINIWARTGRERWTGKTLDEVLAELIPVLPEDFNPVALKKNWTEECKLVADKKGPAPKVIHGIMRLSFVDNRRDIPSGQKYVSQTGKIVEVKDCSFISAVEKNVRVVTPAQEILLTAKIFLDTGEYLARDTWEFISALLVHKKTHPVVSVAFASSGDSEFYFYSVNADYSNSYGRLRLAL